MSDDPAILVARRYARGATVGAVVVAAGWHLGHDLPIILTGWSGYLYPWLAVAASSGYLLIGVAAAVALLRSDKPIRAVWAWAVAALTVVVATIVACPPDQVTGPLNWSWGSIGWLGVILFWRRRHHVRELCLFLAADAAIVLTGMIAAGFTDRVALARYLMVLVGILTLQIGGAVGGHALDAAARWAADASARRAETEAARRSAELVHADRLRRYEAVRLAAADLLTEIANGADPADERLRRDCAVGAARLRRLMAETDDAPEPLLRTLRAHVADAERRRVLVTMEPPVGTIPDLPPEVADALADAPARALRAARTEARVTVYATPREVIVSVVADTDDEFADGGGPTTATYDGGTYDGGTDGGGTDGGGTDGGGTDGGGTDGGGTDGGGTDGAEAGDAVVSGAELGSEIGTELGLETGSETGSETDADMGAADGGVGTDGAPVVVRNGVHVTWQREGRSLWIQSRWPVG
ncbi:hypothetical protein AB0K60_18145 [Thermopolyspora sp. NPDC052614]|uniref:hypothetical protein n=1 Tax=Thermopolyspora sp. NPDC052614 TaxID=3155682 RepID=UPI003435BC2D